MAPCQTTNKEGDALGGLVDDPWPNEAYNTETSAQPAVPFEHSSRHHDNYQRSQPRAVVKVIGSRSPRKLSEIQPLVKSLTPCLGTRRTNTP